MSGIRVIASPVVFTNNAGGGDDELQAPQGGQAQKSFDAGGQVQAAWWVPLDNIPDLSKIHFIQTTPNGSSVTLTVGGVPGNPDGRVRILIYANLA